MNQIAEIVSIGKIMGLQEHCCDERKLWPGQRKNAEGTLKAGS
jgi:hypothetical protein